MVRDERGRLRVGAVDVQIQPETAPADAGRIGRCLELFEDYCVVTQSVRTGLPVTVEVKPVHTAPATAGTDQLARLAPGAVAVGGTYEGPGHGGHPARWIPHGGMESSLAEGQEGRQLHDIGDVPGHRDDLRALRACGVR
jgi:hypothetical protein